MFFIFRICYQSSAIPILIQFFPVSSSSFVSTTRSVPSLHQVTPSRCPVLTVIKRGHHARRPADVEAELAGGAVDVRHAQRGDETELLLLLNVQAAGAARAVVEAQTRGVRVERAQHEPLANKLREERGGRGQRLRCALGPYWRYEPLADKLREGGERSGGG